MIEYAANLPEAPYTVITPYLVPPGPKKVNVGDGFILDSATKLLGARPAAAFTSRTPLGDEDIERINASRILIAVGANTLKDNFELTSGFDEKTLARIKVPIALMGVGHYGVAEVTRALTSLSKNLFCAFLERFPLMSVRCDASRRYVVDSLPDCEEKVLMTSCPVVHAVDEVDRGFKRRSTYDQLVVTITDRVHIDQQLTILKAAIQMFPATRRVLALHQDYGNQGLWKYAENLGFVVERSQNHQDFLRLYADTDVHFGNRVHAHLKCLSLGVVSFCTPFDLRQHYFAESLDFPIVRQFPDPACTSYDFSRVVARRSAARIQMNRFVCELLNIIRS